MVSLEVSVNNSDYGEEIEEIELQKYIKVP